MMPWVHLYINTDGLVKACCSSRVTYGDIGRETIQKIWHGKAINEFRQKLCHDQPDTRCQTCYDLDKSGGMSMRKTANINYAHHFELAQKTKANGSAPGTSPVYLDIRFSNICNFRCRTCWHGSSSNWFEESKILKRTAANTAFIKATTDTDGLFEQIELFLAGVEEIYFAGGEPLLMEEHLRLLQLLDKQKLYKVKLRYNSNLSHLKYQGQHFFNWWKKFQDITIGASLDAINERGEYIRKGQVWHETINNIQQIKAECPHIRIKITPTVSIYNVLHLPDYHQSWVESNLIAINDVELNVLHRPNYLNIKILPAKYKEKVKLRYHLHTNWIQDKNLHPHLTKAERKRMSAMYNNTVTYLYSDNWTHLIPKFLKENQQLDLLRNESLDQIFPWLAEMVNIK